MSKTSEIPIFGGRWQPFHNGHHHVLRSIANKYDRVALAVVNPDPTRPPDASFDRFLLAANPLSYWERVEMLHRLLVAEGWASKVIVIPTWHPRVSMTREANYFPPAGRRFWNVPLIDESEERKIEDLQALGERVLPIRDLAQESLALRSTVVRQRIIEDTEWENLVPAPMVPLLRARLVGDRTTSVDAVWPIVAGRFQPPHRGHLWLIEDTVRRYGRAIVGVVHAETAGAAADDPYESFRPLHNPFRFWERALMLTDALADADLLDRVLVVPLNHPRAGPSEDQAFLPDKRVWVVGAVSLHEYGKIASLRQLGEAVDQVEVPAELTGLASIDVRVVADRTSAASALPEPVLTYLDEEFGWQQMLASLAGHREEALKYSSSEAHRRFGAPEPPSDPLQAERALLRELIRHIERGVDAHQTIVRRLTDDAPEDVVAELQRYRAHESEALDLQARLVAHTGARDRARDEQLRADIATLARHCGFEPSTDPS